jgi:hypothetical protein
LRQKRTFGSTQASFGFIYDWLGHGQQHDAAVRCELTTIEGGCDLLARNGWK